MPYCPKCGIEVPEGSRFCPGCGLEIAATEGQRARGTVVQRPIGVTILAVLQVLGGLAFLGLGLIMLAISGFLRIAGLGHLDMFIAFLGSLIVGAIGVVMIVLGILGFALAYGYWNGSGYAWPLGLGVALVSLLIRLLSLPSGLIGVLIDVLIIYYLTRPHVKKWFGKRS